MPASMPTAPAPPSRPAIFVAIGLLSFLAVLISYLAGRGAGLPPDDPQYFGVGVSIALACACAVIVVLNKRLRRTRRALAELSARHAALLAQRREDLVVIADDAPLAPTLAPTLAPAHAPEPGAKTPAIKPH